MDVREVARVEINRDALRQLHSRLQADQRIARRLQRVHVVGVGALRNPIERRRQIKSVWTAVGQRRPQHMARNAGDRIVPVDGIVHEAEIIPGPKLRQFERVAGRGEVAQQFDACPEFDALMHGVLGVEGRRGSRRRGWC